MDTRLYSPQTRQTTAEQVTEAAIRYYHARIAADDAAADRRRRETDREFTALFEAESALLSIVARLPTEDGQALPRGKRHMM